MADMDIEMDLDLGLPDDFAIQDIDHMPSVDLAVRHINYYGIFADEFSNQKHRSQFSRLLTTPPSLTHYNRCPPRFIFAA
jgi:hypothetical protein